MGSWTGKCRSTPPSARRTSTLPEPAKRGSQRARSAGIAGERRARRPRSRPLPRRPDQQGPPGGHRLDACTGRHRHRRTARRRPTVPTSDATHPCGRPAGGRPRTRPDHVLADRAYSSRAIRSDLRRRGIAHTIPEKQDQAGHRLRRGSAGGRPPSFDAERYKARHKVECRIGLLKQARGVATRCDKLACRYEATIQVTLIRQYL